MYCRCTLIVRTTTGRVKWDGNQFHLPNDLSKEIRDKVFRSFNRGNQSQIKKQKQSRASTYVFVCFFKPIYEYEFCRKTTQWSLAQSVERREFDPHTDQFLFQQSHLYVCILFSPSNNFSKFIGIIISNNRRPLLSYVLVKNPLGP